MIGDAAFGRWVGVDGREGSDGWTAHCSVLYNRDACKGMPGQSRMQLRQHEDGG